MRAPVSYITDNTKLKQDYNLNIPVATHGREWDIPKVNFERDIPGWNKMGRTERIVCRAVEDPFFFHTVIMGYCGKDPKNPVALPAQGEWLYGAAKNKRFGCFAPVAHGKSICLATSYPLWRYLNDCNIRTAIVSANKDLTENRMLAIESHLVENLKFIEIFNRRWGANPKPTKRPGITDTWRLQKKVCFRTKSVGVSDATFTGYSFLDKVFGSRFDLEIFDDIIQPLTYAERKAAGELVNEFDVSMDDGI